jgi:hypothetical protein
LAAAFGDQPGFEAGDITRCVGLHLVDPHVVTTNRYGGRSTRSHMPLPIREEYSCYIGACHCGASAMERAARYDFGSIQYLAERRALASSDASAGR